MNREPDSSTLGGGTHVAMINKYGLVTIFAAREVYDDVHDIVPTQEINLQCTAAEKLRDKLNEWFPQPVMVPPPREIHSVADIDTSTPEGKLLMAMLVETARCSIGHKTPNEVLREVMDHEKRCNNR